jgi:hypothetical protein
MGMWVNEEGLMGSGGRLEPGWCTQQGGAKLTKAEILFQQII